VYGALKKALRMSGVKREVNLLENKFELDPDWELRQKIFFYFHR